MRTCLPGIYPALHASTACLPLASMLLRHCGRLIPAPNIPHNHIAQPQCLCQGPSFKQTWNVMSSSQPKQCPLLHCVLMQAGPIPTILHPPPTTLITPLLLCALLRRWRWRRRQPSCRRCRWCCWGCRGGWRQRSRGRCRCCRGSRGSRHPGGRPGGRRHAGGKAPVPGGRWGHAGRRATVARWWGHTRWRPPIPSIERRGWRHAIGRCIGEPGRWHPIGARRGWHARHPRQWPLGHRGRCWHGRACCKPRHCVGNHRGWP
mmetsp:Transcript_12350/g.30272  ORF Transcript_12350/g.30272 Transcript_12350/m.30272 type:complete len:261 (+) Transcript_12350:24-806(+)